jgi:uncharacterized protein (DUF4415 family)
MSKIKRVNAPSTDIENPEWTEAEFAKAVPASQILPGMFGEKIATEMLKPKGGRPKTESPKVPVTIRLSAEVATYFKSTGKGWQTRMDEALKQYVHEHK